MKKLLSMISRLVLGFFLCASGTVLALNSNLGLSPWDVFHQGLTNMVSISMGQASIMVGLIIVALTALLGLGPGLGTIANMLGIGFFIDFIIYTGIIPQSTNLFTGVLMMIASLFAMALGSYLYIGCEMGCGPRDGLMVALVKRTGKSVSLMRFAIESGALVVGCILGGKAGIGTVITVFGIGYVVQFVYQVLKFDVSGLKHRSIKESLVFIYDCIRPKTKDVKAS